MSFNIIGGLTNKSNHLAIINSIAGNNTKSVKICEKQSPNFIKKVYIV